MRKGRTYLKANDQVEVIAGKDKGRVGKVLKVFPASDKATVERINMIKRHTKPRDASQQGQIVEREAPIHVSNLQMICPECTQTGRIGLFDPSENYLPQPTKVNASKGEFDDTIQVLWQPVEGAVAYRVYRGNMGENEVLEIGMTGETEYRDTIDLSLDHSYFYQIEAVGDGRVSMLSEPAIGQLWSIIFCYDSMWEADGLTDSPYPVKRFMYDAASDVSHYPWIYTQAHHWQYCVEKPGMLWLYDLQLGWIWTRHSFYPNLYQASEDRWLYSIAADPAKRWFYDHDTGSFFPVER